MNEHDTIDETETTTAGPPPRIRWAAIVWGTVFAGVAAWALWVFGDIERRADVLRWVGELTVASGIAYALLGLGALVLILGLIGVLRRAQRRGERVSVTPEEG